MKYTAHPRGRAVLAAAAAAVALTLSACSGGDPLSGGTSSGAASTGAPIIVGSADFSENMALAEIYAGALNAAGIPAQTRLSIGTRETYYPALQDGSIDAVPEYTGNLLTYVDPSAEETSAGDIAAALPKALPEGLAILDPSDAEDKDTLAVLALTADQYKLKTLEDLGKVCGELVLGAPDEFKVRTYGVPGLAKNYGCTFKDQSVLSQGNLKVKALLDKTVQVASLFTTDPAIAVNGLVMLEDPKNNFPAQQVVPLVKKDKISDAAQKVLNEVSAQLTTDDLVALNRDIDGDLKLEPAEAAKDWLTDNGFIK